VRVPWTQAGGRTELTADCRSLMMLKCAGVLAATMKKFDEGKLTFHVGRGEVIAGLDEAVAGMRQGGVAKLRIPPHLGYGTSGAPPKVPPHATLLFDVAVVRIGSRKQVGDQPGFPRLREHAAINQASEDLSRVCAVERGPEGGGGVGGHGWQAGGRDGGGGGGGSTVGAHSGRWRALTEACA
jgi:hypothetical protein